MVPQCPLQRSTEEHKCYNVTMMQNDLFDNEPGHLNDDKSHGYQGDHTLDLQYPTRQGEIVCAHFLIRNHVTILELPEMEIKVNLPPTVVYTPYTGTCEATSNPRPTLTLQAFPGAEDCKHFISIFNTTEYTAKAELKIPSVTPHCKEKFYCLACQPGQCHIRAMTFKLDEGKPTTYNNTDSKYTHTHMRAHTHTLHIHEPFYNIYSLFYMKDLNSIYNVYLYQLPISPLAVMSNNKELTTLIHYHRCW